MLQAVVVLVLREGRAQQAIQARIQFNIDGMQVLLEHAHSVEDDESEMEQLREDRNDRRHHIVHIAEGYVFRGYDCNQDLELAYFVVLHELTAEHRVLSHEKQVHHQESYAHHATLFAVRLEQFKRADDRDLKQVSHRFPIVESLIVFQVIVPVLVLANHGLQLPSDSPHLRADHQRKTCPDHEAEPRNGLPIRFVVFAEQFRIEQRILRASDLPTTNHFS